MNFVDDISRLHAALLRNDVRAARVLPVPPLADGAPGPLVLFPGAFNPLHQGHRRMADVAAEILQRPVEFEISIENVDKPPLSPLEVLRRLEQFPPHQPLWLTRASHFAAKARCFPQAIFVVGVDTLLRVADARYYRNNADAAMAALASIADLGCTFLVFGRADAGGFRTLSDLRVPRPLLDICREVPASQFRVDMSSSELRIARNA